MFCGRCLDVCAMAFIGMCKGLSDSQSMGLGLMESGVDSLICRHLAARSPTFRRGLAFPAFSHWVGKIICLPDVDNSICLL
jgi:hypothetical protein